MSLAWAAGGISSLTLVSQNVAILPIVLCCLSASVALFSCSSLPETHDQPLPDSLEHITPHTRWVCVASGLWPEQGLVFKPLAMRTCQTLSIPAPLPEGL